MNRRRRTKKVPMAPCRRRHSGQAIVLVLFFILTGAATAIILYNTGQTSTEKTRLVNAADAAAYSGAVWTARQLNFMAYTNRAMVANHVAVGHFISYVSWARYAEDVSDNIATITSWVPYLNAVTRGVKQIATAVRTVTEAAAPVYVQASEGLNQVISAAQVVSKGALLPPVLQQVMDRAAKEYADSARVNNPADFALVYPGSRASLVLADIPQEMIAIFNYTKSYNASNDGGRILRLTQESYGEAKRWIEGDRGWSFGVPGVFNFDKDGETRLTMSGTLSDWQAVDKLDLTVAGKKTQLGKGTASAREFASNYRGVSGYMNLGEPGSGAEQTLTITAHATMDMSEASPLDRFNLERSEKRIAALARAEVSHLRPDEPFFEPVGDGEYANLFNPFWDARLSKIDPST